VAAGEAQTAVELRIGDQRFAVRIGGGRLDVARAEAPDAEATLEGEPGALAQVLWHGLAPDDAAAAGRLVVGGSRPALERFLAAFPPPLPADAAATR